jgi:uncharacterized protein
MYLTRALEKKINEIKNQYCCITIYGARQVGKSTMVDKLFPDNINYITLDDIEYRTKANEDPKTFLENFELPIIIDEVQKAYTLFDEIKIIIDKEKKDATKENRSPKLLFILTGSNRFELQSKVSESLAGRTAIFELTPLSLSEQNKINSDVFDARIHALKDKYKKIDANKLYLTRKQIYEHIFAGGMPEYVLNKQDRETFFRSYIQTYIEKDVKQVIAATSEADFIRFLEYMALRTAQQIEYSDISRNLGIDARTVKNWISILVSSGLAITLSSYAKNLSSRITKMEKFYFIDTGLCSYLCKWNSSEQLENCSMNGAFYETFVVSEIVKSFLNTGKDYRRYLYYYRDRDNKECDLIIEEADSIYPIEIKKGINPVSNNFNFKYLEKYKKKVEIGLVIDSRKDIFKINDYAYYCPIFMIGC